MNKIQTTLWLNTPRRAGSPSQHEWWLEVALAAMVIANGVALRVAAWMVMVHFLLAGGGGR